MADSQEITKKFEEFIGEKYINIYSYINDDNTLKIALGEIIEKDPLQINELMDFSICYGICEIFIFLYVQMLQKAELTKLIEKYGGFKWDTSEEITYECAAAVRSKTGVNDSFTGIMETRFRGRKQCLQFIGEIIKKSKYCPSNGRFYYQFNPVYTKKVLDEWIR